MPLRILNLLNSSHRRGAEAFAVDLAEALAALGADVHSAALTGGPANSSYDIDVLGHGRAASTRALARLLGRSRNSDVVVGHGGRTLITGAVAQKLSGRPFVYRVIGEPLAWAGSGASFRRARVGMALRSADAVVGYVDAQTADLAQQFGVAPTRVHVIPKGIKLDAFSPVDENERLRARRALGLDGAPLSAPLVAYVGALTAQKNVEQVIRSVALVPDARLVVVGAGPHEPVLRTLTEQVSAEVIFTGAVRDPRSIYAAADVVALTSRTEGVPTVLLEAALMGLPVVASRVGGIPETVLEGRSGLLVDLDDDVGTADAISFALDCKAELGEAARSHGLETWDIRIVAEQWLQLLTRLSGTG